jgi:hypothetical protein
VDRTDWMWFRMMSQPAILVGAGIAIAYMVKSLGRYPALSPIASIAPWILLGSVALALFVLIEPLWRLWRFSQGKGPACRYCSGPVGGQRQGRWGSHRRCMNCRENTAASYYERIG